VEIIFWDCAEEAEMDEMWSFVRTKAHQRWLWYAIDHNTRKILAYIFGEREINGKNEAFLELKALLEPFGITTFYTDGLSTYERDLQDFNHEIGKKNTQRIERKNPTLRTRIKRLCRKTICHSKCQVMHDIVIGLVINILEFGLNVFRVVSLI
jgi:insertion element IS1 protein InsB